MGEIPKDRTARAAFDGLNLNAEKLEALGPEAALKVVTEAIEGLDEPERMRATEAILGKGLTREIGRNA